jgi:hypothetical protein
VCGSIQLPLPQEDKPAKDVGHTRILHLVYDNRQSGKAMSELYNVPGKMTGNLHGEDETRQENKQVQRHAVWQP